MQVPHIYTRMFARIGLVERERHNISDMGDSARPSAVGSIDRFHSSDVLLLPQGPVGWPREKTLADCTGSGSTRTRCRSRPLPPAPATEPERVE